MSKGKECEKEFKIWEIDTEIDWLNEDMTNAWYDGFNRCSKIRGEKIQSLESLLREAVGNTSCTYSIGSNATAVGTLEHSFNCFKCSFLNRPEVKAILGEGE